MKFETQPSDGLVIVLVNIDDEDHREQLIHRIVNLPSVVLDQTRKHDQAIFEIYTGDWDDGLWNDELEYFRQLLFGDDSLVIWQFADGEYSRFTLTAND